MAFAGSFSGRKVPCEECPLRGKPALRDFDAKELDFVRRFKIGELNVAPGTTFLDEGTDSAYLYTVLSGWAFRFKSLADGRRQILNFALPADLLGLQASVFKEAQHSAEALTPLVLCVFPREKLWELYSNYPSLAFDLTWLAAREERILDENLLSVGRRSAIERMAFLFMHLFSRAARAGLTEGNAIQFPFTQQHVADTLGMSLVHANKTLARLRADKLIRWKERRFEILDRERLMEVGGFDRPDLGKRPFI